MYHIEITDTFGGEANYCWVKRATTKAKSRKGVVNAVKDRAGWNGWLRVSIEDTAEGWTIRPSKTSGVCQIAFVHWEEE